MSLTVEELIIILRCVHDKAEVGVCGVHSIQAGTVEVNLETGQYSAPGFLGMAIALSLATCLGERKGDDEIRTSDAS